MNVEATVAERVDLFGEKLHSLTRVAENDRLRNLKLVEKRGEAVQLLLLLQVSVVLSQTLQSQLIGGLDVLGLGDVLLLERLDLLGVGCREKRDLGLWHNVDNRLNNFAEVLRKELVDFIKDEKLAKLKICNVFVSQIQNSSRGGHNDVHSLVETVEIVADLCATGANHALDFLMLAEVLDDKRGLHGELTSGH